MSYCCDPMNCRLLNFLCRWDSSDKNTEVDCHFHLQRNFLTQELNPGLLHCREMLYQLSYMGSFSKEANPSGELIALKYYLFHLLYFESEPQSVWQLSV